MSLPRMSWHIGDYHKDTGHLRAAEHGAYFLLCMHYWATGGLPDDDRQLAAIARMTDKEWKKARPIIEPFFKGDGAWKHKRIEAEIAEAQAKYERRASAGSKGGKAKSETKHCSSNATAKPKQPITLTDNPEERVRAHEEKSSSVSKTPSEAARLSIEIIKIFKEICPNAIPPDTGRADVWLEQGYRAPLILATLREIVGRQKSVKPLKYYDGAIADAHAVKAPKGSDPESEKQRYFKMLDTERDRGTWPFQTPKSAIPPEIISVWQQQQELPDIPQFLDRRTA